MQTLYSLISRGLLALSLFMMFAVPTGAAFADVPFGSGRVTLTFDDGWLSQFVNARPILNTAGIKATFYINSQPVQEDFEEYMQETELSTMHGDGHDIGGHTATHAHLVGTTSDALIREINDNRTYLQGLGLGSVDSFAYPYGEYNDTVKAAVQAAGYTGARTVDEAHTLPFGPNFSDTDKFQLRIEHVTNLTSLAEAQSWIDTASSTKTWLILMFHEIVPEVNAANCVGDEGGDMTECSSTGTLQSVVDYLVAQGVCVPTMHDVLTGSACGTTPPPPTTWTITASAGAGGSITPSGAVSVANGANQTFTITPDDGFGVAEILVDGESFATSTSFTFTGVIENHTIAVSFAAVGSGETPSFTFSATASGPGSVACNPSPCETTYATTTSVIVTAAPSSNASVSSWSFAGCSGESCEVAVSANTSVTATFACNSGFHADGASCVADSSGGATTPPPSSGGGGGSRVTGGGGYVPPRPASAPVGQVLGAATGACYQFARNLAQGSTGADVTELQKILIAKGYLKISAPTTFFGPMTAAAVSAFQKDTGLEQVGLVGPKTRALLNACGNSTGMTDVQKQEAIKALQAKLEALLKQIADLVAKQQTN